MKRKIRKLITGIMTASILSHFLSGTVSMAAGIDGVHIAAYVGRFCGAKRPRCVASGHSF